MNIVTEILAGGEITKKTLRKAQESTFVTVVEPKQQYSSFVIRIILASIIATGGIATDSTAVIVGSMIIAPLMSPMIGVALAAVLGRPRSTMRALGITAAGMLLSILISFLMALIIPFGMDITSNSQVVSRMSPRLVDLIIALASSFMASIVIMRDDVPDALAGVAISASIVPPLCVVGVSLAEGNIVAALGSFLLFLTNFFAIQIAGIITFAALGLGSSIYSEQTKRERAEWYGVILFCAAFIFIPLAMSSNNVVNNAMRERAIRSTAITWLQGTSYQLNEIHVTDGHVSLEIIGSGDRPSMKLLGARLQDSGIEVKDIRMAVIDEFWYRPSAHPNIEAKSQEELELFQKGATTRQELEYELAEEIRLKDEKDQKDKPKDSDQKDATESSGDPSQEKTNNQ